MPPQNWGQLIQFERVINESPNDSFLFIDPPYQERFYTHSFSRDNHGCRTSHTIDGSSSCRHMMKYRWVDYKEQRWNYTINGMDDSWFQWSPGQGKQIINTEL